MHRHKPRSPGVSLRDRAAGTHFWDDETSADGGKARLRRRVRRRATGALRLQFLRNDFDAC